MSERDWHIELVDGEFWGKAPHPAISRLREIESVGGTVISVSPMAHSAAIMIVWVKNA